MAELKKIGILSSAKMQGMIFAVLGLIAGFIYAMILSIMLFATGSPGLGIFFGFLALIGIPIVYGISGFAGGAIMAFLYNMVAGWTGGLELDFKE